MYKTFAILLLFSIAIYGDAEFAKATTACDKFALSSVDVLVQKQKNVRAISLKKTNFYSLDNLTTIDVIGSNISQLCEGIVRNFPTLRTLSLINANLTDIEPGAFQNVPKLEFLSLAVNRLTHIPRGVFNIIKSLKSVYLTSNEIESIEDAAFAELPNLKAVHLDHNRLVDLTGNIFFGSRRLSLVDFSYNQLTSITESAFDDLKSVTNVSRLNIRLQRNQIKTVHERALNSLPPIRLHLEYNFLTRLSEIVAQVKEFSEVFIGNNQIECIPDDVLDLIKVSKITLDVSNNPVDCQCVDRITEVLSGIESKGQLNVNTTLRCSIDFPSF
ncbi:hypothetical protein ABEB36_014244 [Hypothenemus hampei]|uniref:Uncharacterized protein n=1 Tax=Hypothenemus hampei TaxID=57062 RepID=A0ABD1E8C5_HYPHA